jgi:hypothetical protein
VFQVSKWVMRAHFRHLRSKSFLMIQWTPQSNGFWPLQSLSKDLGIHRDSNCQSGSSLGVWRFIPSHYFALLGAWDVIPKLSSWPTPLQTLALVESPRLGLRQLSYYVTRQVCHHTWFEKLESFVVFKMGNSFFLYLVEQFQLEFNSIY